MDLINVIFHEKEPHSLTPTLFNPTGFLDKKFCDVVVNISDSFSRTDTVTYHVHSNVLAGKHMLYIMELYLWLSDLAVCYQSSLITEFHCVSQSGKSHHIEVKIF